MGTLFIVSTPIGNLSDITLRAIETLKHVDLVISEDTRRTGKLLAHFQIKKPQERFDEYVEEKKIDMVVARLQRGEHIALVSSAGTPLISDPGYKLVRSCIKQGISITPIPGASSVLASLVVSGLPPDKFLFLGFLPKRAGKRKKLFRTLSQMQAVMNTTVIFFESPKRITKTLQGIKDELGNKNAVIVREVTKMHEEILRGSIKELLFQLGNKTLKGEVTVLLSLHD